VQTLASFARHRTVWCLAVWGVLAAGPVVAAVEGYQGAAAGSDSATGYDPQRADLTLAQIAGDAVKVPEATATPRPLSRRGARRVEKARALLLEQRYTEASLELEKALQSDPDSPEVHLELARVLRASGSTERCRTHLEKARSLRPGLAEVHYLLALSSAATGELTAGVRELRIAELCEGTAPPDIQALALYRVAERLRAEGYFGAALGLYRQYEGLAAGIDAGPGVDPGLATLLRVGGGSAAAEMAEIHEARGDFSAAADELARAAGRGGPPPRDRSRLVELLSRAGRHAEAVAEARRLAGEDPSQAGLLVEAHRAAGRLADAVDEMAALAADSPAEPAYVLALADLLLTLGRDAEAEEALRRYCADRPGQPGPLWRLFSLYVDRADWPSALGVAAEAVRAGSAAVARARMTELPAEAAAELISDATVRATATRDQSAAYLLACLALREERADLARDLLSGVLDRAPDFMPARVELAELLLGEYRWQEAIELLGALAEGDSRDARVERLLGLACSGLDDDENAVFHLQAAVSLNREDARALKALGELYERTGRPLQAIRRFEAAAEINPLDAETCEALFNLYLTAAKDREQARAQLDALRRMAASPHRIARCEAWLEVREHGPDYERFRSRLTAAMDREGPDARSLAFVGISLSAEGRYPESLEALRRAAELAPDDTDIQVNLADAHRLALDFGRSAQVLRDLLRRHPNRHPWRLMLHDVLVTDQRFDAALALAREQLARDDLDDQTRLQYREAVSETLLVARRYDELIDTLLGWRADAPEDADVRRMLASAYVAADRPGDALSLVREWRREAPGNVFLRELHTQLLVELGRGEQAARLILELLENDPDNDDLQLLLVDTLSDMGRHEDAIELATNCLVATRRQIEYQMRMIAVYDAADRPDDAVRSLAELIHQQGMGVPGTASLDVGALRRALAVNLINAGRHADAEARLARWIEQATDSGETFEYLRVLSFCQLEQGQRVQATETLEQAYALRPLDAWVNNDLAYNWVDQGVHLEPAERMLRYAVAREPRNHAYLDSLGWALYKKGEIAEAVEWLTRATRFAEVADPVILDHLADALWRAGRREEAVENWRRAVRVATERLEDESGAARAEDSAVLEGARGKLDRVERDEAPGVAPAGPPQDRSGDAGAAVGSSPAGAAPRSL